jgi:hypothetical protein
MDTNNVEKECLFRNKNGISVPYIEFFRPYNKFLLIEKIKPLPIKKIIVGPHKDKELRVSYLQIILRDTDIEVAVSDIPYILVGLTIFLTEKRATFIPPLPTAAEYSPCA